MTRVRKYHPRAARNNAARKHEPKSQERAQAMEPPPLTGRSPKRRARRSSNQDVIPPSVTAACKTGDDAVVAQFLAVRSNLLQLDTHAEDTSTLLHVAAESGTTKVIELLLANGASHRSMWKRALPQVIARVPPLVVGGPPHPRRAEESRARLSLRGQRRLFSICFPLPAIRRSCLDEDGQTALHMATAAGHLDAVKGTLHIAISHSCTCTTYYPLPTTYYSTPSKASPEESARSSQCWTSIG